MKKKVIIIVSVILVMSVMGLILIFLKNDEPINSLTDDEIRFKEEYEKLNGVDSSDNILLKTIEIDSDNNVKYVTDGEIVKLLTNGTNVIYFGWADCNWCRTILPVLIPTLKENSIDTLYYYDFKDLRDAYLNEDEEKSIIYENIISVIGDRIETTYDENDLRSGEKKILAPTVVFIKNGEFIGLHSKTVDSHIDANEELSLEESMELKQKYLNYIDIMNANVCVTDEGC